MLTPAVKVILGGGWLVCAALCVWTLSQPVAQRGSEPPPPAVIPSPTFTPPPAVMPAPRHSPMTQAELPTTDGEISLHNIIGAVHSAETMLARQPKDAAAHAQLVGLLLLRGQILGRIADAERALEVAEQAVRVAPGDPRTFLVRAQARGQFHDWQGALADLDQTEQLARKVHEAGLLPVVSERRAAVLRGLGRLDAAAALLMSLQGLRPSIGRLTAEASLLAERGDFTAAESLFIEAQRLHSDVTPFPVAWLYLQEGLMWEARGNLARAHELYSAAHERLPAYAAVRSHLAGVEVARARRDRAIALLQPLVEDSAEGADDPEYAGQLAQLMKEAGDLEAAARLRTLAQQRYEALLIRHPAAFASHAARFYLGAVSDGKAAVKWAERDLAERPTAAAYSLAIEANTAAGLGARACALADDLGKQQGMTAQQHVIAARAYQACGQPQRADAELKKVTSAAAPE